MSLQARCRKRQNLMLWRTNGATRTRPLWRLALGSLLIVCLTLTLANRFRGVSNVGPVDVRAGTPKVKVQHRDVAAHGWAAPAPVLYSFRPSDVRHKPFFEARAPRFRSVEVSLYNRPLQFPNVLVFISRVASYTA